MQELQQWLLTMVSANPEWAEGRPLQSGAGRAVLEKRTQGEYPAQFQLSPQP